MSLGFRVVASSHVGLVRTGNEDAGLASSRLLAVADGMGGHAAGEVASAAVIQSLVDSLADLPTNVGDIKDWLLEHINEAHGFVGDLIAADPDRRGMGTTLTVAVASDDGLVVGHIGDSRIYRLRDGELEQLSTDHTYVEMLVESGEITAEQALHHPRRNLLLRAIDGIHAVELDLHVLDLRIGDRYLLCSDGLSGLLAAEVIRDVLGNADPTLVANQLIDYTLAGGAADNVTVVIGDVTEHPTDTAPFMVGCAATEKVAAVSPAARRKWYRWLWLLLLPIAGFLGFNSWLHTQWFVGSNGVFVTVYQGVPQSLGPFNLANAVETSALPVSSLDSISKAGVERGIAVESLAAARETILQLRMTCAGPGCATQ